MNKSQRLHGPVISHIPRLACWTTGLLLLTCAVGRSADYELPILAVSSFESARVPAMVELDFGRPIDPDSMRFLHVEQGEMPFYFVPVPGSGYRGRLYWMWDRMPFWHETHYRVLVSDGLWSESPVGDADLAAIVNAEKDLLPNSVFDLVENVQPVGWTLEGSASIAAENAYYGRHAVRVVARFNDDGYTERGRLRSQRIPLLPDTRYRLRVRATVVERRETDPSRPHHAHQGIAAQLTLFNADGRHEPRIWRFNRLAGRPDADLLNRRLTIEAIGTTSSAVREGVVEISPFGLDGVFDVDEVFLETWPKGHPHRFEIGTLRPAP